MIKNEIEGKTANQIIQAASNYIGQKLFAYISHGKNINDRIREKFSKAMIFIGDEGQIYNPLTNTYIGIGQTAYTNAVTYIEEAHEKIDALNKMLTSSMVTSIYANWDEETWRNMTYITEGKEGLPSNVTTNFRPGFKDETDENKKYNFSDVLPTKVFATNDIVLRGIGDYDPNTKLAYTKEIAHIVDQNNIDPDGNVIDANAKRALEGSYIITDQKTFATSGITVSLEKGLNKYMFTYTFSHPSHVPGADPTIWSQTDQDAKGGKISNYAEKVTFYFTKDEIVEKLNDTVISGIWGGKSLIIPGTEIFIDSNSITREDVNNGKTETVANPLKSFYEGMVPVWDDEVLGTTITNNKDENGKNWHFKYKDDKTNTVVTKDVEFWYEDDLWLDKNFISHHLFKQGKNVMTIDDKLTWSYISSAYSYALDFSKEYTDSQVERIYRDLLGSASTLLIPCSLEQVKVQKVNPDATKDLDFFDVKWSDTSGKWETTVKNVGQPDKDGLPDSSKDLTLYKLSEASLYVKKYNLPADAPTLYSSEVNSANVLSVGETNTDTILPWFILTELAKISEKYMKDWELCYTANPQIFAGSVDGYADVTSYIMSEKDNVKYPYREDYTLKIQDALANHTFTWNTVNKGGNIVETEEVRPNIECTWSTSSSTDWNKIYFMNYERDTNYPDSITIDGVKTDVSEDDWKDSYSDTNPDPTNRPDDGALKDGGDNGLDSNDMSKHDKGEDMPEDGKWGVPTGTTGSNWGNNDKLHEHGYRGRVYSFTDVYRIIDNLNDLVAQDGNETDTSNEVLHNRLFVVNTKWTSMDGVNLADGIQTLKEITYVLDIITDGWGNHYEDAEGNGILLTYTIANNHDRIVDHEKRLKQIESGKNVVKGIGRLDHMMSNYVDLQLTSDVLWEFKYDENITVDADGNVTKSAAGDSFHLESDKDGSGNPVNEFASFIWNTTGLTASQINQTSTGDIFGIPETMGFIGVTMNKSRFSEEKNGTFTGTDDENYGTIKTEYKNADEPNEAIKCDGQLYHLQQIPVSYIIAYNSYVRNWVKDQTFRTQMGISDGVWPAGEYPRFKDVFPNYATIGVLKVKPYVHLEQNKSGDKSSYYFASPEGRFVAIHSYVGHVGIGIDLKLAQTYTTSNINGGTFGFVCVDAHSQFIKKNCKIYSYIPLDIDTNNKITWTGKPGDVNNESKRYPVGTIIDSLEKLNESDKAVLKEHLADMGIDVDAETPQYEFVETILENRPDSFGATFKFDFEININDAIDEKAPVFGQDYGAAVWDKRLYCDETITNINDDGTTSDKQIYKTTTPGLYNPDNLATDTDSIIRISSESNYKFYVRYINKDNALVKAVDLDYDGLTTTNWVATYVAATVDSVSKQLKEVEFEAYRFSESLIRSLDKTTYGSRGKFVAGIDQKNGIVTPIFKDLPKDELLASYTVWGENTDFKRDYVRVTAADIRENEVLHGGSVDIMDGDAVIKTVANDFPLYVAPTGEYDFVLCTPENAPSMGLTIDGDGNITDTNINDWASLYRAVPEGDNYKVYTFDEETKEYVQFAQSIVDEIFGQDDTYGHDSGGGLLTSSWRVGKDYGMYVPMYFRTQKFERVDGAQLRRGVDEAEFTLTYKGNDYSTASTAAETAAIFTTSVARNYPNRERKYISAVSYYNDQVDAGNGKNTLQVTAHITKLADADQDNSGLVDAYDVKATLNSMFEWVDLSRWDLDKENASINPMNSDYQEAGGDYTDQYRTDKSAAMKVPTYPRSVFTDKEYSTTLGYTQLPDDLKKNIDNKKAVYKTDAEKPLETD